MPCKPSSPAAYDLLHRGSIALAQVEQNGMRVDLERLHSSLDAAAAEIKQLKQEIQSDKIWKLWRRMYGEKADVGNRNQLGHLVFGEMGYKARHRTAPSKAHPEGQPKMDEAAFDAVDLPVLKKFIRMEKINTGVKKLKEIRRETVNGFAHSMFSLNVNISFRGASELPNLQNIPVRFPEAAAMVRNCIIPSRDDDQFIEIDFSGIEVKVGYCYHKDPVMRKYLLDPTTDMHRDVAIQIFKLDKDTPLDWWDKKGSGGGKDVRHCSKNKMVFPEFYGSRYVDCAENIWDAIKHLNMTNHEGVSLYKHLRRKGITSLGECTYDAEPTKDQFVYHILQVEKDLWEKRFKGYADWKKRWYNKYLTRGWADSYTGFVFNGYFKRNEINNYPIQGSAFHCLLWSLIQVQKRLKKYKMKARIINQVHDSMLGSVPKKERKDYLEIVKEVTTVDLLKHWKWIIIPMEIEAVVAPVGGSWNDVEKVKI
jgi:DNA polymerase I